METYEFVFTVVQENVLKICQRNLIELYQNRSIWTYIPIGAKFTW